MLPIVYVDLELKSGSDRALSQSPYEFQRDPIIFTIHICLIAITNIETIFYRYAKRSIWSIVTTVPT